MLLLVILIAIYFALEERSYPVRPQTPFQLPSAPEPKPKRQNIHVTVIHPNGSSTSTYFPIEVRNGEDEITIDYRTL